MAEIMEREALPIPEAYSENATGAETTFPLALGRALPLYVLYPITAQ